MANVTDWNAAEPLDTHHVRFGAQNIREAKALLEAVIADEHEWGSEEAGAHSLGSARAYVGNTVALDQLRNDPATAKHRGRIFVNTQDETVHLFINHDSTEGEWITHKLWSNHRVRIVVSETAPANPFEGMIWVKPEAS